MAKIPKALLQLAPATSAAIEKLGADLAVARLRRKEFLKTWAKRLGVTVPTLQRLEAGDPGVSIGIVATALWLLERDGELGKLAAPEHDHGALEMNIRERRTWAGSAHWCRPRPASPRRMKDSEMRLDDLYL